MTDHTQKKLRRIVYLEILQEALSVLLKAAKEEQEDLLEVMGDQFGTSGTQNMTISRVGVFSLVYAALAKRFDVMHRELQKIREKAKAESKPDPDSVSRVFFLKGRTFMQWTDEAKKLPMPERQAKLRRALGYCGHKAMVTPNINKNSLNALMAEYAREKKDLPPSLAKLVKPNRVTTLKTKKG